MKSDGSVGTWGLALYGGDSAAVADQLAAGVVRVYSTGMAFLALRKNGNVVTWGSRRQGGHTPPYAQAQLVRCVERVYSNALSWVAVTNVGRVVLWGGDPASQFSLTST